MRARAGVGAETHARSLAKAVSYRVLSTVVVSVVAYSITRRFALAAAIGLGDALLKIGLFYLHERIWARLPYGRVPPPERDT